MNIKLSIGTCCMTLLITMLLFSCKKNSGGNDVTPPPAAAEKVAVKFGVSDFTREITDFGRSMNTNTRAGSLKDYISFFYYMAYDNTGKLASSKIQTQDSLIFGSISDSLRPGSYTIVMIGAKNRPYIDGGGVATPTDPSLPLDRAYISFMPGDIVKGNEVFLKKFSININGDSIVPNVSLTRIVGKIELTIQDSTSFHHTTANLSMDSQAYYIGSGTIADPYVTVGGDPYVTSLSVGSLEAFVLNNKNPFDIRIKGYNASNQLLASKTITNVQIQWNKKLILKGKLFSPDIDPNFSIDASLNDWSADSTIINF
ncbi:Fimbrillin-A associated anchor protein Mfa1 and Mfa2 [Chitinophaga eiseniae]|uniref:Fimbrillin-A associated anchor protein Mfa1 and Mfa2 n=1 Tax=Chitinophaga eiseniae TaxID=634771 RepID=A0A1T4RG44_9BACT|nr:FimB/Mfa2 family fimbrial subunit [Chitinophaga eiseniae]SKA14955.1 Fimbrillin-A associated anchor protein Mfa1 and Mfa2 [Chitinophaga eiseniae]